MTRWRSAVSNEYESYPTFDEHYLITNVLSQDVEHWYSSILQLIHNMAIEHNTAQLTHLVVDTPTRAHTSLAETLRDMLVKVHCPSEINIHKYNSTC